MTSEHRIIKDIKKHFPYEFEKLEETVSNYKSENDLNNLRTESPDKRNFQSKNLEYPYEHFNSIDDTQKQINNLKRRRHLQKTKQTFILLLKK